MWLRTMPRAAYSNASWQSFLVWLRACVKCCQQRTIKHNAGKLNISLNIIWLSITESKNGWDWKGPLETIWSCFSRHCEGMWPNHGTLLSSPSLATKPESCQCATGQIRQPLPILRHGLTGSWKVPTALDKESSTPVLPGWLRAGSHMSSWQDPEHCSGYVIAGRALVVAQITVRLVTWWAQGRCLLAVRERWDGQPWCEAGRALGRMAGPACGDSGWLFCLLILLSITASALVRDTTSSWYAAVTSLLWTQAGDHHDFLQGHLPKYYGNTYRPCLYPVIVPQAAGRCLEPLRKGAPHRPPSLS